MSRNDSSEMQWVQPPDVNKENRLPAARPLKIGTSYKVAFSPDGAWLVALGRNVVLWDLAARKKVWRAHPFKHPGYAAFSPDGRHIAIKSTSGAIVVLDVQSGGLVTDFDNAVDGEGCGPLFSPDGTKVVDGSWAGSVFVREADSGSVERVRRFAGELITAVHTSSDRSRWVVVHDPKVTTRDRPPASGYVSVWHWPIGIAPDRVVSIESSFVRKTALSPAGDLLAVVHGGPYPEELSVLRLADGRRIESVPIRYGMALGVAWAPDGSRLASVQGDVVVQYRWPDLAEIASIAVPYPQGIAYSPAGGSLAIGACHAGLLIAVD